MLQDLWSQQLSENARVYETPAPSQLMHCICHTFKASAIWMIKPSSTANLGQTPHPHPPTHHTYVHTFPSTSCKLDWVGSFSEGTLPFVPCTADFFLMVLIYLIVTTLLSANILAITLRFLVSFSIQNMHFSLPFALLCNNITVISKNNAIDSILCFLDISLA